MEQAMANGSNPVEALEGTRSLAPPIPMVLTAGHLMVEKEATEQKNAKKCRFLVSFPCF